MEEPGSSGETGGKQAESGDEIKGVSKARALGKQACRQAASKKSDQAGNENGFCVRTCGALCCHEMVVSAPWNRLHNGGAAEN